MIVAGEGPSAAGKATWCRSDAFVPEYSPTSDERDDSDLDIQATYRTTVNSNRWSLARALEAGSGLAICDSDPRRRHFGLQSHWRDSSQNGSQLWIVLPRARDVAFPAELELAGILPERSDLGGRRSFLCCSR